MQVVRERPYAKNLRTPDETEEYERSSFCVVELGDITVGRVVMRPGWRWSVDLRPSVGGDWCEVRHAGVVLEGRLGHTFRDGTSLELGPDDLFVVPPGHDAYTIGDADCVILDWSGVRASTGFAVEPRNRVIATLLFTDLVGSTERARALRDVAWHDLLSRHFEAIRTQLERHRGREFETTGDGMLATFESTAAALRCAAAIVSDAAALGLHVRAGVHVGEVQLVGSGLRGLAVHEAARVMSAAAADEILASETTKTLASASNLRFVDRGFHQLKGLAGARRLYAYVPTVP